MNSLEGENVIYETIIRALNFSKDKILSVSDEEVIIQDENFANDKRN